MSTGSALNLVFWFVAILALIPIALWLLKRSPVGAAAAPGPMRTVAVLPLAPSQRLVTVEVGRGEQRRWLVLGVTGQQITTLHEMPPQDEPVSAVPPAPPFAQIFSKLLRANKDGGHAR